MRSGIRHRLPEAQHPPEGPTPPEAWVRFPCSYPRPNITQKPVLDLKCFAPAPDPENIFATRFEN